MVLEQRHWFFKDQFKKSGKKLKRTTDIRPLLSKKHQFCYKSPINS